MEGSNSSIAIGESVSVSQFYGQHAVLENKNRFDILKEGINSVPPELFKSCISQPPEINQPSTVEQVFESGHSVTSYMVVILILIITALVHGNITGWQSAVDSAVFTLCWRVAVVAFCAFSCMATRRILCLVKLVFLVAYAIARYIVYQALFHMAYCAFRCISLAQTLLKHFWSAKRLATASLLLFCIASSVAAHVLVNTRRRQLPSSWTEHSSANCIINNGIQNLRIWLHF